MKTLVIGSNGQLGQALVATAPAEFDLVAVDRAELDISDADLVSKFSREVQPAVIINAAAYTAVDEAESHEKLAHAVNAAGPRNVAGAAMDVGARLIHLSTDFVFDGEAVEPYRPDSVPHPLGVYGRTKRVGGKALLQALPTTAAVIRTAWLYS